MSSETKRFIVVCFFVAVLTGWFVAFEGGPSLAAPGAPEPQEGAQAGAEKAEQKKPEGYFDANQKQSEADTKSAGCVSCHTYNKDNEPYSMHPFGPDNIGCADCHGGKFDVMRPEGTNRGDKAFEEAKLQAHVMPKDSEAWYGTKHPKSAANPKQMSAHMNTESLEFIQFVNPGDLRVVERTCGNTGCHEKEVSNVDTSIMKHGAMLWGAALYNNGAFNMKNSRFGESYTKEGQPERLYPAKENIITEKDAWDRLIMRGQLPYLDPLPRWEMSQPGNILRIFEHGEDRLSLRGLGTANRTDPVFLGLQKTRLLDPTLNFLGTNEQAGDYRSSGCSACHVIYANDRYKAHGAPIVRSDIRSDFSNRGVSASTDPMVNNDATKGEGGHPIRHIITNAIPSSNCMVCHIHPGTNMVTTYFGMLWWDNETDAEQMYDKKIKPLNDEEIEEINRRNPEESALRGKWGRDPEFLAEMGKPGGEINNNLTKTQFADYHGHGWVYRAIFKIDRRGNYLDHNNNIVQNVDAKKLQEGINLEVDPNTGLSMYKDGVPVHLKDVHLELGMHCVDCHFEQDGHGNGNLYSETRAAVEIDCVDCHGTIDAKATLKTSGPAAEDGKGRDLKKIKAKFLDDAGKQKEVPLFQTLPKDYKPGDRLPNRNVTNVALAKGDIIQNSYTDGSKWWRVKQTIDTVVKNPAHPEDYSELSAYAKTVQVDNQTWGDNKASDDKIAHPDSKMTCFACHTSWTTSCFGCHLPMRANKRRDTLHNEGTDSRNWTNYNFQTLRDDVYMLGRDGIVTGSRIAPIRSSCAILVTSQSINREWFYSQQQTISAEGYSGQAFSSYVPHTVRGKGETKQCADCHVNKENNNNAVMAHLTVQGTNAANWIGRYAYVGFGKEGFKAVAVTERDEPQAVYGSSLQKMAFPSDYENFVKGGNKLRLAHSHGVYGEVLSLQARGEYIYVARGEGGMEIYDTSRVDDKLFSQRLSTSIVSPLGQRLWIKTKYATSIASPTTLGVDPTATIFAITGKPLSEHYRKHNPENNEAIYRLNADDLNLARLARIKGEPMPQVRYDPQPIAPLYAFLYITDKYEGLVMTNAATLLDGDPENNFLKRSEFAEKVGGGDHWNPEGKLDGARSMTIAGNYGYICANAGVVVVDISEIEVDKEHNEFYPAPKIVKILPYRDPRSVQIQFRYGFVTTANGLEVFDITDSNDPKMVDGATVSMSDARNLYLTRSWAFVAAGAQGLAIVDIESPTSPKLSQSYTADGQMNDVTDVKTGMTNNSLFAYVADGKNGFRVVQLTSTEDTPGIYGFAPPLSPKLIASYKGRGPALAVSEGIDRDRAVDESGNQLAVFGRRGARPFNGQELRQLYISSQTGQFYTVSNQPPGPAVAGTPDESDSVADEGQESPEIVRATAVYSLPAAFDLVPFLLPTGLLLFSRRKSRRRNK